MCSCTTLRRTAKVRCTRRGARGAWGGRGWRDGSETNQHGENVYCLDEDRSEEGALLNKSRSSAAPNADIGEWEKHELKGGHKKHNKTAQQTRGEERDAERKRNSHDW